MQNLQLLDLDTVGALFTHYASSVRLILFSTKSFFCFNPMTYVNPSISAHRGP